MNLLCIDPAASCGYCLVSVQNDTATIYEYGFIDIDDSEYVGDRCIQLMDSIRYLIEAHSIEKIAVEDYFFSSRFATGSNVNVAFRTAIYILCRQLNIHYEILSVSGWKKFVCGRSTPTKEQKKKWGNSSAKKLMVQESLYIKYGFKFPNHSLSKKTNKPIRFRYDIVDAVGQAIYYCKLILNISKVENSMEIPPDENVKSIFNYGDYDGD